jgi:hypothetical protein
MSLVPTCTFRIELNQLAEGRFHAGQRNEGYIVLSVPERIVRVECVEFEFSCTARARYGTGKQKRTHWSTLARIPLHIAMAPVLESGEHRLPFVIDLPAFLPANISGGNWAIESSIALRLSVDWALDPSAILPVPLLPQAQERQCEPFSMRSPPGFHKDEVLEVSLDSGVVMHGEPLRGHLALRSNFESEEDIILSLRNLGRIVMRSGDTRVGDTRHNQVTEVRIQRKELRSGRSVPFSIPTEKLASNSINGFIDVTASLQIAVNKAWSLANPSFEVPIVIVPQGSTLHQGRGARLIGQDRFAELGRGIASATPLLASSAYPIIASGAAAGMQVTLTDAPTGGTLGVAAAIEFPAVDFGLTLRKRGVRDLLFESKLTPEALRDSYAAHFQSEATSASESVVTAFLEQALKGLDSRAELHMSDHHLRLRVVLPDESNAKLLAFAKLAVVQAEHIHAALANLPFSPALSAIDPNLEQAWRTCAVDEVAFLVASGPSLSRIERSLTLVTGERLMFTAHLDVHWTRSGNVNAASIHLHLGCSDIDLGALGQDAGPDAGEIRSVFPDIVVKDGHVVFSRAGAELAPGVCLTAMDAWIDWYLAKTGKRRVLAPYR